MRMLFGVLRVAIAAAIVAAIVGQLIVSITFWHTAGLTSVAIQITNFFSFFTIDSNVLAAVVALIGAVVLFRTTGADPRWYSGIRLAAVTYMATTGIVYNLLLRGIQLPQGATLGWSNEVLHLVAPLYLFIDWLFAPGRRPLESKSVWPVLIFPFVWGIYTLIRGPLTYDGILKNPYWYPYPFMNPNTAAEGYFTVAFYIVMIALVIGVVCFGAVALSKRRLLTEPAV
jgi:hypothetical protein